MLLSEFDEEKDWAIIAKGFEEIGYDKGVEKGKEEGKKEGRKEGRKDNIKEIINFMLSKGKSKAEIIDLTGITSEEYDNSIN